MNYSSLPFIRTNDHANLTLHCALTLNVLAHATKAKPIPTCLATIACMLCVLGALHKSTSTAHPDTHFTRNTNGIASRV